MSVDLRHVHCRSPSFGKGAARADALLREYSVNVGFSNLGFRV